MNRLHRTIFGQKENILSPQVLKIGLFVISILLMYFREPAFFLTPRFWAEEGSRYFPLAYRVSWHESLLTVQNGYFGLWPNLATTLAAHLVPLRLAPLVTTLLAFFVQVIPISIIIWSNSELFRSLVRKVSAILIVLLAPLSGEIWLNTVNSQFYFSLITFLILHENVSTFGFYKAWWYRTLLMLAGLTGTVSCFLTPFFFTSSWLEKKRERLIQLTILVSCSMIQLGILASSAIRNEMVSRSPEIEWPILFSIVWTKSVGLVFGGLENANVLTSLILTAKELPSTEFEMLAFLLFMVESVIFLYLGFALERKKRLTLLGSYFIILLLSTLGALGHDKFLLIPPLSGQRYYYVPNVILLFIVLANIKWTKKRSQQLHSALCITLLTISLSFGASEYTNTLFIGPDWPNWPEEVEKWEEDGEYKPRIWPPDWKMPLRNDD